jgi:hypothetical protein
MLQMGERNLTPCSFPWGVGKGMCPVGGPWRVIEGVHASKQGIAKNSSAKTKQVVKAANETKSR